MMNDTILRKYTTPEIEVLSLEAEPFMLDEGLTVGDVDDPDIMLLGNSTMWTPWE